MNKSFKSALFNQNNDFYEAMKGDSDSEKEARFNVYRNNVFVSLIDSLADIFPVTQTIVGEDFFRAMAREFIQLNPPISPIISDYGDNFTDFIRHFEPAKSVSFLGDLAALEFSLLTLTNAQENKTLEREDVVAAFNNISDPANLYLTLSPTTQILVAPFAIGSIYLAHKNSKSCSLTDIRIEESELLLLSKSHLFAEVHIVSRADAVFIKHLMQGKAFGEAIPDDNDFDPGSSLAKLIDWRLLTKISEAGA
ncbi:DNA-binding domain-containing protein [Marinomonas rhizomae]|uniref:Putative DNA-binding protein n=1 Tax=Marinomonas rhizomae TaxID=491948 RepID=A0A366J9Y2_9GAMM|nr:DNA-binding domain-containing protein [Marinomonas rhizomae]RBP83846.1 putative DNA-binding protein [Marinomonas rhizomae]